MDTVALAPDGNHLTLGQDSVNGLELPGDDRAAYPLFLRKYRRFARLLQKTFLRRPPRLAHNSPTELARLAGLALEVRLLGKDLMRELLRTGAINIYDVLQETFADKRLKGALSLDALLGANLGPRSPGSVLTFLYRLAGQWDHSGVSLPAGGMSALARALRNAAETAGVEIRTATPVKRVLLEHDRAAGVETASGEQIAGRLIVSNGRSENHLPATGRSQHMETGFVRRINNIRMQGKAAKLHLALDGLPEFRGLTAAQTGQRLLVAPSMDYLEQAFDASKYGRFSEQPALEISIPTSHDQSLAPSGKHVLSAIVQYVPFRLRSGWETGKDALKQLLIKRLEQYAPGIGKQVIAAELLGPPGPGNRIQHAWRPLASRRIKHGSISDATASPERGRATARRSPDCTCGGAGCHPGGGITGLPGYNAARKY